MMSRRRTDVLAGAVPLVVAAIAGPFPSPPRPAPGDDANRAVKLEPAGYRAPAVISVRASYPGADAPTVADTVAGPIEQQVDGVEGMQSMSSASADDGSYTLHVTFKAGTDLAGARAMVQDRVALAVPILPALVKRDGIPVREKSPGPLVLVSLTSTDDRFDDLFLGKYATVKGELARLPGVSDVVPFGRRDDRMRVALDPDKLAALQLSATDVVTALSRQGVRVAGGPIGQAPAPKGRPFELTVNTLGTLTEPGRFENVIVKAAPDGRTVRLKDVARVEPGGNDGSAASLDGKPAALLSIHPLPGARPGDVSRAVLDRLAGLRAGLPDGLALAVAFDFAPNLERPDDPATPEHLVIDAELPGGASAELTARTLGRAAELLRKTPCVQGVLALTEHPFSLVRNRPCLVVRLAPKDHRELGRGRVAADVRAALLEIPEAVFRPSVPSAAGGFPVYGFPVDFAIEDRGDLGTATLRECAGALGETMRRSGKFSDVDVGPGPPRVPALTVDVDGTRCLALGVEIDEIFNTMQAYLGGDRVNDLASFRRTRRMKVPLDPRLRAQTSDILRLKVRNKQGQMVPLGTLMEVRDSSGPRVIERHNLYPIARITANLAEGVPPGGAKSLCETLAREEFGARPFKLAWRAR